MCLGDAIPSWVDGSADRTQIGVDERGHCYCAAVLYGVERK